MSQKMKDGIIIDNTVFIVEDIKRGFPIYMRLLQLLAIMVGSWSSISILIESFSIPVTMGFVNVAIIISGIILFFLFLFPYYDLVKVVFIVTFYGLFWYSRLPSLKNGFYIIENLILGRMKDYYGFYSLLYKANYSTASADTTLLIIMVLIPIMALLTIAILRCRHVNLCNIILFLPVAVSFAIGLIPSERYFIVYIMIMLYLTRAYISGHQTLQKEQKVLRHRVNSRAAIWLSSMCLVLFFLMKAFVSSEKYEGVVEIKEVKSELQTFLLEFSLEDFADRFKDIKLFSKSSASGGLNGGQLGRVDEVIFNEKEHLRVTASVYSVSEGIYLKGYVGSEYFGDSWKSHSRKTIRKYEELLLKLPEEEFSPINQNSILLSLISDLNNAPGYQYQFYKDNIKIEYLGANKNYIYAPYFSDYKSSDNVEYRYDLYAAPKSKKDDYEFDYYFKFSAEKASSFLLYRNLSQEILGYSELEKQYRNFVNDAYTKLPENKLDRIVQEFSGMEPVSGTEEILNRINYVRNYLHINTKYSLSPGMLPKGKDFVEYFLYENKVGYCSHYASAAVIILRAMKIPARYIEGYAIGSNDIVSISRLKETGVSTYVQGGFQNIPGGASEAKLSVRDSNAHAWVEVYIDGCGWVPIEFTPGADIESTSLVAQDMLMFGEDIDKTSDLQKKPTDIQPEPTAKPKDNEAEVKPTGKPDQEKTENTEKDSKNTLKVNAYVFLITFAICALVLVASLISVKRKKKVKYSTNFSMRALLVFEEIEKILKACKGLPRRGGGLEDNEDYIEEHCTYVEKGKFSACIETARKARFGKNTISSKELKEVEEFHNNLYKEVYKNMHLGKKIYLKIIMQI